MSFLEWSVIGVFVLAWLLLNIVVTIWAVRGLGRYSTGYVLWVWCLPVLGALMIGSRLRAQRNSYLSLSARTEAALGPRTLADTPTLMQTEQALRAKH